MSGSIDKIVRFAGLENIEFSRKLLFSRNSMALSLQFVGLLLAFGSNILLARLYGDYSYGIFSLVSGWAVLFSTMGLFGMDDRHLARVPLLYLKGDGPAVRSELFGSLRVNLVTGSLTILLFFLLIRYSGISLFSSNYPFFIYAILLIPCYVLMYNLLYFLRALKWIIKGEITDKIIRPLAFAMFLLLFYYSAGAATPEKALMANISGLLLVILVLSIIVRMASSKIPGLAKQGTSKFNAGQSVRYTFLNLLYILSTRLDLLMLGLFVSASQVGHYSIASRFGDIFSYPVAMLNLSFPVLLSEKIHQQDIGTAALFPFKIARNAFWLCLLTGIVFILIAPWILALFGKQFGTAFHILPVLLISTLLNASAGLSDVLFIITGNERKVIISRVISLITTTGFAVFLIPRYEMTGAAFSMLAGNIVYYSSLQFYYFREFHLVINPFFRPAGAR